MDVVLKKIVIEIIKLIICHTSCNSALVYSFSLVYIHVLLINIQCLNNTGIDFIRKL